MNKSEYLHRIGIEENITEPNLRNLKFLQRQHLLTVPFENLDIHWKRPILLDLVEIYKKIVINRRGGFCYELNGIFNELLKRVGYQTKIISARVSNGKDFGAEYDHQAILTQIDGKEFLTDVGFGDFSAEPLQLVLDKEQTDDTGVFKFRKYDHHYFEIVKKKDDEWKCEYIFKDLSRNPEEFSAMCHFHQTSSESHFTRGKVCSIMTNEGRKTLTDNKFIETSNGEKHETQINSKDEFNRILEREFSIMKTF